jgi:cyclic beta-1,2-glucan glucanotransferase
MDLAASPMTDWTGDRWEFIGRNGTLANPAALNGASPLSNTDGAGLDPCGVLRTTVELLANGVIEIVFVFDEAGSADDTRTFIERYRAADFDAVRSEITRYWDSVLNRVQVKTPDR